MVVKYAVKVFVDVVQHIHNLHGGAVVAKGCKPHNVAEVDGHLLKELGLHFARLLQRTHHRAVWSRGGTEKTSRLIDSLECKTQLVDMTSANKWCNTFSVEGGIRLKEKCLGIQYCGDLVMKMIFYVKPTARRRRRLFITTPKAAQKVQ